MKFKQKYAVELEELFKKSSKNKKLLREFLKDLLTPLEYKDLAIRWQIVKGLKNKIPHRKIAKNLKVSVATINRGSRELINKKGGFNLIYEKFYKTRSKKKTKKKSSK